jgi:hypothetical protein
MSVRDGLASDVAGLEASIEGMTSRIADLEKQAYGLRQNRDHANMALAETAVALRLIEDSGLRAEIRDGAVHVWVTRGLAPEGFEAATGETAPAGTD